MARKLPSEAYQLAETYQLGTPIKRYTGWGWIVFGSCMITFFFLLVVAWAASLNPFMVSNLFMVLFYIGIIVLFIVLIFQEWSRYAYECTDGFVIIARKTRQVRHILHWNEVLSTHTAGAHNAHKYVTDIHQQTIEVPYYDLWKRCTDAVAHHDQ